SHEIVCTVGDGGQHNCKENTEDKPSAIDMAREFYSQMTGSSLSSHWTKLKSILNQVQIQLSPPNLDFTKRKGVEDDSKAEQMKAAAQKSFETSKTAMNEAAKSAAKVVGETVHETAGKVKDAISDEDLPKDEL
ncbi:hypothetical protein NMG60_11007194, partial [Bertholletia excelsa]